MNWQQSRLLVTGLYLVRMAITLVHGRAHDQLEVPLALWQHAFVWGVIVLGPTAAVAWLWIRPSAAAGWSLAALLAAGWLFGLYFHFGPPNPDHVGSLPSAAGREAFLWSALGLAVIEPVVAAAAVWSALAVGRERARHA